MFDDKYIRIETHHPYGPVTLTVYTPSDAEWIERHIRDISLDLHHVQSAIVSVAKSFIVLEREIDQEHLHFAAQSYRPPDDLDESSDDIAVDVLAHYSV